MGAIGMEQTRSSSSPRFSSFPRHAGLEPIRVNFGSLCPNSPTQLILSPSKDARKRSPNPRQGPPVRPSCASFDGLRMSGVLGLEVAAPIKCSVAVIAPTVIAP